MEKSKKDIIQKIQIHIRGYEIYLVNLFEESIEELSYCTFSIFTTDDEIVTSEIPHYQIQKIPSKHAVHLETLDGMEDGTIYYQLNSLKFGDFIFDEKINLDAKKKSGMTKLLPIADCPIVKIKTEASSIVKIKS